MKYSSLKLVSREVFFVEALIIPNPAPQKLQVLSFMESSKLKTTFTIEFNITYFDQPLGFKEVFVCPTIKTFARRLFSLEISSLATEVLVPSRRKHKGNVKILFFYPIFYWETLLQKFCAFYYKLEKYLCMLSFPDCLPRSRIRNFS